MSRSQGVSLGQPVPRCQLSTAWESKSKKCSPLNRAWTGSKIYYAPVTTWRLAVLMHSFVNNSNNKCLLLDNKIQELTAFSMGSKFNRGLSISKGNRSLCTRRFQVVHINSSPTRTKIQALQKQSSKDLRKTHGLSHTSSSPTQWLILLPW